MGYANLVRRQVMTAFTAVGDLAFNATLRSSNAGAFDFATQTVPITGPVDKVVKAVMLEEKSPERVSGTLRKEILFSAEDVPSPDIYDKVVIDGVTWNVVPPYRNDGYLITMLLAREA